MSGVIFSILVDVRPVGVEVEDLKRGDVLFNYPLTHHLLIESYTWQVKLFSKSWTFNFSDLNYLLG